MTTSPTHTHLRGRLITPTGPRTTRPRWQLQIGAGLRAAGPAGPAVLRLPTGVHAAFDYQHPERILAVEVPCLDDEPELPTGSVDEEDLELLGSLVGDPAVAALKASLGSADPPAFDAELTDTAEQALAGRMALLATCLDDQHRPTDGLWAAELVGLMQRWDQPALAVLANDLAHVAAPALRLLSPTWDGTGTQDDHLAARLLSVLLACEQAAPSADLGALLPALRERFAPDVTGLERWLRELTVARLAVVDLAVAGAARAGDGPRPEPSEQPTVLLDHTLRGWLTDARAQLTGGRVTVRIEPAPLLADLTAPRRLTTRAARAADDRVELLDVSLALVPDHDGTLTTTLDVPPDLRAEQLLVTIGRHLPLGGDREPDGFARRQLRYHARRLLDARRRGEPTDELQLVLQQALPADHGREPVAALLDGPVPEAFLAESLPISELLDTVACRRSGDAQALAAARSLLWPRQPTQAARMELARIATGDDEELTLAQLDALLFDTLSRGQLRLAGQLDEEADRRATQLGLAEAVETP